MDFVQSIVLALFSQGKKEKKVWFLRFQKFLKKISRRRKKMRRKKRKRLEIDVLASRSKVWDFNIVCVYILIWLCCCFGCDL